MFRTPFVLVGALGVAAALATPAAAAPACDTAAAGVVHEAEEVAATTPAGSVTTPVTHGVVEPAACALP